MDDGLGNDGRDDGDLVVMEVDTLIYVQCRAEAR